MCASSTNTSTSPFSDYSNKITTTYVTNRSFTAGEWQAICLPFDLDEDELKSYFGSSVSLAEYTALSGTTMTFTPQTSLHLHAGVPYAIKPSVAVGSSTTFTDVVLNIQQPKTISFTDGDNTVSFTGTFFTTTTATDGTISIISNGALTSDVSGSVIGVPKL